ncbi:DUF3298 domain-containing protein [Mannheimia sp. AT1]|uniref:DUF3298 domain-containing protein n=1 Tax=Mannheimia cairinae TaxID=3025936 RepID=A0ABT5MMM3_9PAST|nr:DUF3298 domain-containing protein [Mannheimia cairinae]MDD0823425.1 DUF3298 domain-containing protein [Mannheimia cairinae]MDD0826967.1 DUF3298 domain-containing protein [Mannheimia cairinae]
MKKSLLALLVVASIAITGCEDQENTQKLQNAEKTITQLGNELKAVKLDLEKQSAELTTLADLKAENEALKSELDKAKQAVPLQVEMVKLFDKQEIIKHEVDPNDEFGREESEIASMVVIPRTNLAWLNSLLIKEAYSVPEEQKNVSQEFTEKAFRTHRENVYQMMIENVKEEPVIGYEDSISSQFIGQRNNIATFTMQFYTYGGGAHGLHYTQYINVNLDKEVLIDLNELISPQNQEKLKAILWKNYRMNRLGENGKYNGFAKKEDFRLSPEFYFSLSGITFVYPPYELGPYAEGDVEVEAGWFEVNQLLNPDYQRTEKDGFYEDE